MEFNYGELTGVLGAVLLLLIFFFFFHRHSRPSSQHPPVPAVGGGVLLLGNLLQLKEKKPFKKFTEWAEIYGPIYSIKLGFTQLIVLSSTDLAKEALTTRFLSITNKKLPSGLKMVSGNKLIVASKDYNDLYKTGKRFLLTHHLGINSMKLRQGKREAMVDELVTQFNDHVLNHPGDAVNFKEILMLQIFGFALKLGLGRDVESFYVEEFGKRLSKKELHQVLVGDVLGNAVEVDWRDFFPCMKWMPNRSLDARLEAVGSRRLVVMNELIKDLEFRGSDAKQPDSFLEFLKSEGASGTQLAMSVWEVIFEVSDGPTIAMEWAMFDLAKDQERQTRLYQEIQMVCGSRKMTEDDLPRIPYLDAVFHETLRIHNPVPILPIRIVHEDTHVGGYHIPAGAELTVNVYGCNWNRSEWEDSDKWKPERFLHDNHKHNDLYKTASFGVGKRACIGARLGTTLSCLTVGRLVQEFEWRLNEGEDEDAATAGLTTNKLHPLHVILKQRTRLA